jgi:hypothetical protein
MKYQICTRGIIVLIFRFLHLFTYVISYFLCHFISSSFYKNIFIRRLMTVGKSCLLILGENSNLDVFRVLHLVLHLILWSMLLNK